MSAKGMMLTVLATGLASAVAQDDQEIKDGHPDCGYDLAAGMFGAHVSKWLRETAALFAASPASPASPAPEQAQAAITVATLAKASDRKALPIMRALNALGADVTLNQPLDLALIGAALSNAGCRLEQAQAATAVEEHDGYEQALWLRELFRLIEAWRDVRDGTPSKAEAWSALWSHAHNIGPHWRARAYVAASPAPQAPAVGVSACPECGGKGWTSESKNPAYSFPKPCGTCGVLASPRRDPDKDCPYCLGSGTSQVLENGKHVDARCSCTYAASGVLESRDDQQEKRDGAR